MSDDSNTRSLLEICDRALSLPDDERDSFLQTACADDEAFRARVESVLGVITQAERHIPDRVTDAGIAEALVGTRMGDYQLTELIGEGGMGAVYLAERALQGTTQRVAIKVIRGGMLAQAFAQRFEAERRILASLNHPYIARLLDLGEDHGMPFLVMEYIEGKPVDQYLDEQRVDIRGRVRLLQKIALAVHAAHQNLIVHRDLKPSNVLVTEDGIPKLLDFGIAKLLPEGGLPDATDATRLGQQAMTPDYASPEQILDNAVTTASDVYSLGVLSYTLLVGVRPYRVNDESRRALVESVDQLTVPLASERFRLLENDGVRAAFASQRDMSAAQLHRALAGDLETILAKALARDPLQRYASVAAFSADLERYLAGEPVDARTPSLGYRLSRFVQRHRVAVGFSAALVVSLVGGLVAAGWSYYEAEAAIIHP